MKIPTSLLKVYSLLSGAKIYGHLTTPDVGTTSTLTPFQTFHVPNPSNVVKTGDIIRGNGRDLLLLMDAPQTSLSARTFRAYQITTSYAWKRKIKRVDPVSHMERDEGDKLMGTVYAYFEKPQDSTVDNMVGSRYQFYTGQDVKEGDMIGDKLVKRVIDVLGVKLVVAE